MAIQTGQTHIMKGIINMRDILFWIFLVHFGCFTESWPQAWLTADPPGSDVFLGGKVTLTCRVIGSEGWKYTWTRETVGINYRLLGNSGQDGETYILHPVRKTNQGLYQCRAQRGRELSDSNFYSLRVHDIPNAVIRQNPPGPVWFSGETVTLECDVKGGSGWRYSWAKRITETGQESLTHSSKERFKNYTIQSVKVSDSGEYICQAERGSETVIQSRPGSLYLNVSDLPQALLTLQPGWTDLFPTERVTLRCELQGDSTQWEYKWYRDGQELPADDSDSSSMNEDTYIIPSANLSHAGSYQCSGRPTRAAGFPPISNSILLSVYATFPKSLLSHQNFSEDIYTGDRVTFSCMVEGASSGWKYLWYKDRQGTELSNPDNSSTDGSSYTIISAALSHSGQYWCRAQRGSFYSQYSDPLQVDIHAPPQAVLAVDTGFLQILTKDSLMLRCEVEGSSVGWSYTWYADGTQLPEDQDGQNFTVTSGNGSYHREYKCRGNTTEKPFYSTISNGLVPNVIVLLHILVISTSGFVLLSVIMLTLVCLIRRRKSGQIKKMHDNELYVSSLGMKSINVGRRTTAIYEEVDDPGKGLQEQSGFVLYSTIQKLY